MIKRINKDTKKEYQYKDKPTSEDLPKNKDKIFLRYRKNKLLKSGFFVEEWISLEKFNEKKIYHKNRTLRYGNKEINPETNKIWKRGEVCKKRGYFWEYQREVKNNGNYKTTFYPTFEHYHNERIKTIFMKRRIFAKKNKILFNISKEYLKSIFPKDFLCPILNIKMEWTGKKNGFNNPSLDRIYPKKGYVEGNVTWISYRANTIKNDASVDELEKILNYTKNYYNSIKN